jgi:superfamily II DNA/RNA helicase
MSIFFVDLLFVPNIAPLFQLQSYIFMSTHRFETLQRLLDFTPGIYGIIFTRTRQDCQDISEKLMKQGYHVSPLHGDMDQKMRSKVLERFKNRTLQAIVATDVAARGIDVNDITHVINYELPDDPEVYTHRSGRTARAGKSGICISIVSPLFILLEYLFTNPATRFLGLLYLLSILINLKSSLNITNSPRIYNSLSFNSFSFL